MNLSWNRSESTIEPLEIDTIISKNYIYLHKNIVEVNRTDNFGDMYTIYEYDEAKLTKEEYEQYLQEMSSTETLDSIENLKAENQMLTEQVDMLTACLIEMSEIVYA